MPAPMPRGMPVSEAMATMIPEPTMAFPMPPPVSPTGAGGCTRKAQLSEPTPLATRYPKMASSGVSTMRAAAAAANVASRSFALRTSPSELLRMHPHRNPACGHPDQHPRDNVHDQGDDEQRQPDLDDGAQVQVAGGFTEFVRDDAGHGVRRREKGPHDLRRVSDDHGYGHGLAERASQAQDDGTEYPRTRVPQHAGADHLPARRAQGQHRLTLMLGDGEHDFARDGSDDRQDHDGQNDSGGQHADAVDRS